MKMEQSVPKRRHIKFRRRGITQKKTYNKAIVNEVNVFSHFVIAGHCIWHTYKTSCKLQTAGEGGSGGGVREKENRKTD